MEEILLTILSQIILNLVEQGVNYIIRKATDSLGNIITQIVVQTDSDGDGFNDHEDIIYSFDTLIPDTSDGFCITNNGSEIGIGLPQFKVVDSTEVSRLIENICDGVLTGNDHGYIIGSDVYCPLPIDCNGDDLLDWGLIIDDDDNGIPDASPSAPFWPIGSDGFDIYIQRGQADQEKSFIIVSAEGTVSVYDPNGDLTQEDYDEAYSLWLKDNSALDKPFSNYSVTEALLLIVAIFSGVSLFGKLFKRRVY